MCCCGKKYVHDSGYYRHKKVCKKSPLIDSTNNEFAFDKEFVMMVIEAMGGIGVSDFTNENKIIKRISKEIMVEKE